MIIIIKYVPAEHIIGRYNFNLSMTFRRNVLCN